MNRTYELKYKSLNDLIKETCNTLNNFKEELSNLKILNPEDSIKTFLNSNYDIKIGKGGYITKENNDVVLYLTNDSYKSRICSIKENCDAVFTEIGEEKFSNEEMKDLVLSEILYNIRITLLIEELKTSNKVKTIKGKFKDKLKIKGLNINACIYPENTKEFILDNKKDKVSFMVNNYSKLTKTVPSKEYPLPNDGEIKIFTTNNTEEIEDNKINDLLTGEYFEPGRCYTNAEKILEIIKENNLDYKAEFYCGWLFIYGNMVHHGWVIVNDKHIIDPALFLHEDDTDQLIKDAEKGIIHTLDKKKNSEIVVETIKAKKMYKEKYAYGKVLKNYIYIGVKSNKDEAWRSFSKLMNTVPNHKDYVNIKPNGSNETLDMIYNIMN